LIEAAYQSGEPPGLPVWTADEAGPFQTVPYPGQSWAPQAAPQRQPHEYIRNGTAKLLTLFRPSDGELRTQGVTSATNEVLHGWLKQELSEILSGLPAPKDTTPEAASSRWTTWTAGLTRYPSLPKARVAPRLLLVMDNLAGHLTPSFVVWLFERGIIPLYTPLGGSWLNMAESIQRIIKRRALDGQHPETPAQIIEWLASATRGWNRHPTPFIWGGKRAVRRTRSRQRRYALGGSGALTYRPIRRRKSILGNWLAAAQ
jgi:hypothetical protein